LVLYKDGKFTSVSYSEFPGTVETNNKITTGEFDGYTPYNFITSVAGGRKITKKSTKQRKNRHR
jgi:hypothetical protein